MQTFWTGFEKRAYTIKDDQLDKAKWQNVGSEEDADKNMATVSKAIHAHLRKTNIA